MGPWNSWLLTFRKVCRSFSDLQGIILGFVLGETMFTSKISMGFALLGLTTCLTACTAAQAGHLPDGDIAASLVAEQSAVPNSSQAPSGTGSSPGSGGITLTGKSITTPVSEERRRVVTEAVTQHLLAVDGVTIKNIVVENELPKSSVATAQILHHGVKKTIVLTVLPDGAGWDVSDAVQVQ